MMWLTKWAHTPTPLLTANIISTQRKACSRPFSGTTHWVRLIGAYMHAGQVQRWAGLDQALVMSKITNQVLVLHCANVTATIKLQNCRSHYQGSECRDEVPMQAEGYHFSAAPCPTQRHNWQRLRCERRTVSPTDFTPCRADVLMLPMSQRRASSTPG